MTKTALSTTKKQTAAPSKALGSQQSAYHADHICSPFLSLNVTDADIVYAAKDWDIPTSKLSQIIQDAQGISKDINTVPLKATAKPILGILQSPLDRERITPRLDKINKWIEATKEPANFSLIDLLAGSHQSGNKQQVSGEALKGSFATILAAVHSQVLVAVLEGRIAQQYFSDPNTRLVLDHLSAESATQRVRPGIYCNAIGHKTTGSFLTVGETYQVLDAMSLYTRNVNTRHCTQIDSAIRPNTRTPRRYIRSGRAERQIRIFTSATRARVEIMAQNLGLDDTLPSSILEFGYGMDVEHRLVAHQKHESSNYVMNLFHACCQHLFPGKYNLHQFVLFLCHSPDQSSTAEIFFHLLGNGYIGNGAGFSHWPAGLSSSKAYKLDAETWSRFSKWSVINTPLQNNIKAGADTLQRLSAERAAGQGQSIAKVNQQESVGRRLIEEEFQRALADWENDVSELLKYVADLNDSHIGKGKW
ncbi:hypothetical protein D6D05_08795 [Aureobasidium pullulans]|nr:hypothetical protein D6D05_08795 [Aureobasidium pullulans]